MTGVEKVSAASKDRARVVLTRKEISRLHALLVKCETFAPLREPGDKAIKTKLANTLIKWEEPDAP